MKNRLPGLYIHIPFCKTKCFYCSFYSATDLEAVDVYLHALAGEMISRRTIFTLFDSLYIGGGTPSIMQSAHWETLFQSIRQSFSFSGRTEITVEVNPADLNCSLLSVLRDLGVNRLNIGVQSFQDHLLTFLGRRHNARQARTAIEMASLAGFQHLGLDLIFGIPQQDLDMWLADLNEATAFPVDHLSCYQLTVEPDTPLGKDMSTSKSVLPGERKQLIFFRRTSEFLSESGYFHYEVSNFAKGHGAMSKHNRKYWDHTPYLGLGPSAHSFDGRKRWWNMRSLSAYHRALENGRLPVEGQEILTMAQRRLETLMLGFRTAQGVDSHWFKQAFQRDLLREKADILAHLQEKGLIIIKDGFIRPTLSGMAVADQLGLL